MNSLGDYIAEQRTAKNLSIRKLAELAKISHTEIHRIENGERKHPSPIVLKSVALALNISFDRIMQIAGYMDEASPAVDPYERLCRIDDLTEHELDEVKKFIDFLRSKR